MHKQQSRLLIGLAVFVSFLISLTFPATAQPNISLTIENINSLLFPKVDAYLSASDPQGFPLSGLTIDNFTVSEDGQVINNFTVSPVQNTQQPLAFVIVIDTSGSMGFGNRAPYPIDNARDAAKSFVNSLGAQDQVALVSFATTVSTVQGLTTDKAKILSALDTLSPNGATALYDAILDGVTILKDVPVRKAIILVTDGQDSGAGVTQNTFETATQNAIQNSVPIYPIGFGEVNQNELNRLAQLTGGVSQVSPDSTALQAAFSTISLIFKQQYLLSYTSTLPADGKMHDLEVVLKYQSLQASDEKQFIAQPGQVTVSLPDFTEGQVVGGFVRFAPEIIAPAAVSRMDISIDGGLLTSVLAAPFEYVWDSTSVPVGMHQFTFLVTDSAGNTGSTVINLDVQKSIVITINTPLDGADIGNTLTISATVTSLSKLAKIDAILDDQLLTSTTSSALDYTSSTAGITAGNHPLHISATDVTGYNNLSTVSLNFQQPVEIQFISPQDGEKVSGTVMISTGVTTLDPVSNVEYMVDGVSVGSCQVVPCEIEWALYNVAPGSHAITADVINTTGHKGHAEINVTVYATSKDGGLSGGVVIIGVVVLALVLILVAFSLRKRRHISGGSPSIKGTASQGAVLVELEGLEPNRTWPLSAAEVKLGRKKDENDIPLKGTSASRRHAVIRVYQGQYILNNLNPQNPILVNNIPIGPQYSLQPGDIIQLGESKFRFDA